MVIVVCIMFQQVYMQNILRKEIEAIVNMRKQKKEDRNTLRWSVGKNKK